jgi:hypothetical protein
LSSADRCAWVISTHKRPISSSILIQVAGQFIKRIVRI